MEMLDQRSGTGRRRASTVALATLACSLGGASCRRDIPPASVPSVAAALPELRLSPVTRIDGLRELLSQVTTVKAGPDNTALLLESGATEVRVFDSTGRQLRTIGRRGRGPGELERPSAVGMIGDSIWVSETFLQRISIFTKDGRLVRTVDGDPSLKSRVERGPIGTAPTSVGPRWEWGHPAGLLPDGSMIMMAARRIRQSDPVGNVEPVPIWKIGANGRVVDTIQRSGQQINLIQIPARPGAMWILDPFVHNEWPALSANARRIAIATPGPVSADRGSYTVRLFDETGVRLYEQHFAYVPVPVGSGDVDSVVSALARQHRPARSSMTHEDAVAAIRERLRTAPYYRPIEGLRVDVDGSVWIRGRDAGARQIWTVLNPSGVAAGVVRLPREVTLHGLDRGAWVIEKNADDVPSVVRYRIDR